MKKPDIDFNDVYEFLVRITLLFGMGLIIFAIFKALVTTPEPEPQTTQPQEICICVHPATETSPPVTEPTETVTETTVVEEDLYFGLTKDEVDLLARITMAEAEGETDEGKRLVIDTVLNRVDSEHFPDTVYDVIYQPGHFSPVTNGRLDRCDVQDEYVQLVLEELENRTNSDVAFFQMYEYSPYGEPMFQLGCHYFSSYKE